MIIRNYNPETDYPDIEALLNAEGTFGGQFDEARDTKERIDALEKEKPGSVLVVEDDGVIVGTVTLFEDGRRGLMQSEHLSVVAEYAEEPYRSEASKLHSDYMLDLCDK